MGMFDYLRCDAPLPDGKPTPHDLFQTKDTPSQYMEHYTITEAGRLIHHAVRYEEVPEQERPYWGKPEWFGKDGKRSLLAFAGSIRSIPTGDVDLNWHGEIDFGSYDTRTKESRDFLAIFIEGNLHSIKDLNAAQGIEAPSGAETLLSGSTEGESPTPQRGDAP